MPRRRTSVGPARVDLSDLARDALDDLDKRLAKVASGKSSVADVHRLRGNCRRLETILTEVVAPAGPARARAIDEIRWIRKAAGKVRDADVALDLVARFLPAAKPDRAGAGFLNRLLARERRAALKDLRRTARRRRARRLTPRVRAALFAAIVDDADLARVLRACAARARREAAKGGDTPTRLHKVRLAVKRVRDLAEIAEPVLGAHSARLGARARRISDRLGAFQDLFVLVQLIDRSAEGDSDVPPSLARLRNSLEARRRRSLARAAPLLSQTTTLGR